MENVAVIGASANEERYSNKAIKMLTEHGHNPIPVAPVDDDILGRKVFKSLSDIKEPLDTVTVYIGPQRQDDTFFEQLIATKPKRVIFNPGAENPVAQEKLKDSGIEIVQACTLVMLRTKQF